MWLQKLREFKQGSSMTYKEISDKTGIPLTTIEKLFSGRTKDPRFTMVTEIANAMGHSTAEFNNESVTRDELDLINKIRSLDMRGRNRVLDTIECEFERMNAQKKEFPGLFYDFPVSAGTGEFLDDTTASIITLSTPPISGTDYILRISGDSMEPEYKNGDYVYVSRTDTLQFGEIGIFAVAGSVYMKQYQNSGLVSLNPKYATIPPSKDIRCLGRVLGQVEGEIH